MGHLDVNVLRKGHVVHHLGRAGLFHGTAVPALPDPDLIAFVQDKNVIVIKALPCGLNFVYNDRASSAGMFEDAKQREDLLWLLGLNMGEARAHATGPDGDMAEQRQEFVRRALLRLAVLGRRPVQELVQFDRLVGGGPGLVLGGFVSQPEEDIVAQLVVSDFVRVQHNVAVSVVELAGSLLRPRNDLEVLDSPDEQSGFLSDLPVVPGRLGGGGVILDAMVQIGSDQLHIAVLNVVFFGVY
ncbi:hypothetical protein ATERTT37_006617 [Aspergillus terreus]